MDQLNNLPRWFLILLAGGFFMLTGVVGNNLYAESKNTKIIAYQAKNAAETCSLQVASLSGQIQEIKNSNETFRKEYREDQRSLDEKLTVLLRK